MAGRFLIDRKHFLCTDGPRLSSPAGLGRSKPPVLRYIEKTALERIHPFWGRFLPTLNQLQRHAARTSMDPGRCEDISCVRMDLVFHPPKAQRDPSCQFCGTSKKRQKSRLKSTTFFQFIYKTVRTLSNRWVAPEGRILNHL